jgi:hypothetical protein
MSDTSATMSDTSAANFMAYPCLSAVCKKNKALIVTSEIDPFTSHLSALFASNLSGFVF